VIEANKREWIISGERKLIRTPAFRCKKRNQKSKEK
jgi:hypothetical protein